MGRGGAAIEARTRTVVGAALAWAIVPLLELSLARTSMVPPTLGEAILEASGFAVFGFAQWYLLIERRPDHLGASGLWPGVLVLAGTALAIGPPALVPRLIYAAGLFVTAVHLVRWARRLRSHVILPVAFAVIGTLGARYLVLAYAAGMVERDRGNVVSVAAPVEQLVRETQRALSSAAFAQHVDGPPLVVISVDTLRADAAVTMRTYQRLAERGRGWPRASATSSWTLPSMASLHTGNMPGVHGADARPGGRYQGMSGEIRTLAELLRDAGYRTAAVATNPWLETTLGFRRGFEFFLHANEALPHRLFVAGFPAGPISTDAAVVVDRAMEVLDGLPERGFFLWVHLLDAHMPYEHAMDGAAAGLADGDLRGGKLTTPEMRDEIRAAYRAEVAHADRELDRFLDALEARGVFDDGLVVFVADHGEEFWEHGGAGHGHSHHGEIVDIAMAVAGPGVTASGEGVVSLVDIAPTLLRAAGVDVGGIDLRSGAPEDRIVTLYGNNFYRRDRSARDRSGRVIRFGDGDGSAIRYDLRDDPDETNPLPVPDADPLLQAADRVLAPPEAEAAEINREALRALGYVE